MIERIIEIARTVVIFFLVTPFIALGIIGIYLLWRLLFHVLFGWPMP